ncbi:hypothetical protein [Pantoea sp. A4]|uniref:hypothetical protein n=1 Tax=Pantoea sp. A4 TaxID=1225184 RepID=UPI00036F804F|nr:hypothetical protein [Pantoea sp. A4]
MAIVIHSPAAAALATHAYPIGAGKNQERYTEIIQHSQHPGVWHSPLAAQLMPFMAQIPQLKNHNLVLGYFDAAQAEPLYLDSATGQSLTRQDLQENPRDVAAIVKFDHHFEPLFIRGQHPEPYHNKLFKVSEMTLPQALAVAAQPKKLANAPGHWIRHEGDNISQQFNDLLQQRKASNAPFPATSDLNRALLQVEQQQRKQAQDISGEPLRSQKLNQKPSRFWPANLFSHKSPKPVVSTETWRPLKDVF